MKYTLQKYLIKYIPKEWIKLEIKEGKTYLTIQSKMNFK